MQTTADNEVRSYYIWLVTKVEDQCHNPKDYSKLLKCLFEIPYKWRSDLDSNRAVDGLKQRREYQSLTQNIGHLLYLDGKCSMLEMMIALASRCETEIMGSPYEEDHTSVWFWTMIESLGLSFYLNHNYDEGAIVFSVSKFIEGDENYRLFKTNYIDPSRSIWNQLNDYLMENFDFTGFLKKTN